MAILTCFPLRFTPNWLMFALTVLFSCLFISLGFWQLHRAEEKGSMLLAQALQAKQEAVYLNAEDPLPQQYQNVRLKGNYLDNVFLLDNQHHQHQFGYNVLSPLLLADGKVVLVDRGWIKADVVRVALPEVITPSGLLEIQGTVYFPSANSWLLGDILEKKVNKLVILEAIDVKWVGQILQKQIYPFIIRLDKKEDHGFIREWPIVSMSPQRHRAYAVQWFGMALVVVVLFVGLNLKKKDEKN